MATAVALKPTPKTSTSVDPAYLQAIAQAKASLAAETAPIKSEQAATAAGFKSQEKDATDVGAALSKLLQPIGPAVSGIYQTAGQNVELAGKGFSEGMQDALKGNTDNLNAMLAQLGQSVKLDSHAEQAGDVLYGLGGYNPGTSFSKQGAAFGSAAELQAGDAILHGQQNAQALKSKAIVADQGFQNKIAELAGKLPGDVATNYQKLKSLALADAKFREQVAHNKATEALATAKYKTSVEEFNARQSLNEAKFAQQQFQQDRMFGISLKRLGIAQKGLQLRIAANAFTQANGGYTRSQINGFNSKLDALVGSGAATRPVDGVMPTPQYLDKTGKWIDITPDTPAPKTARTRNTNTYSTFIKMALRKGVPIQLALDRADTIWPETQRTLDPALLQLPEIAAQAVQANREYDQMTGAGAWGGAKYGKIVIAPNADRPGVSTSAAVKSFVSALAGRLKTTLTIGTGSQHNEMTLDGNVSDHWTGHAADVPLSGAALTRAGQQALILAGADPKWARTQKGGLFNIDTAQGRVQIIFNTMQGGNHYTHLHVGVK